MCKILLRVHVQEVAVVICSLWELAKLLTCFLFSRVLFDEGGFNIS